MRKKERRAKINEMLEDIHKQLVNLKANVRNNSIVKNDVWMIYAKLEYAILLVKLESDFETPGGFEYSKLDKSSETKLLELVISYFHRGKKEFSKGTMKSAINNLRKARDALKLLAMQH